MQIEKAEIKAIYLKQVKELWESCPKAFPDFLPEISLKTKQQNQAFLLEQKAAFKDVFIGDKIDSDLLNKKISELLKDERLFAKLGAKDKETLEKAVEEMKAFLQKVRKFAPEMDIDSIGKAARNYMVYSVFNMMSEKEQSCTDAIFAYSMLYPVTDNFIDDPNNSPQEKKRYNQFIKDKLQGLPVCPKTDCEKSTLGLLNLIEKDYSRDANSSIYTVLLCMLEAQQESLSRQQGVKELTEQELFDISAYKGGMSVLADRMFVKKAIVQKEICFYLELGLILQLGDDLQDICQDMEENSQTLMTRQSTESARLEETVNKLLHLVKSTVSGYSFGQKQMLSALEKTCCQLVLFSAYESGGYLSEGYRVRLEKYLPVTWDFITEQKQSLLSGKSDGEKAEYLKVLDEMI